VHAYRQKQADIFSCEFDEVDIKELEFGDEISRTGDIREIDAELTL